MAATVTISVEVELAWGFHDQRPPSDVPELSDDGGPERDALRRLLALCDEFDVPVTFDVVGHLLLESCDGTHDSEVDRPGTHADGEPGSPDEPPQTDELPHPDGWFARDPGTDAATDPLFYAPEAADWIRNASVDHELATHTFSHVLCGEVAPEVVDWELARAARVHDEPVRSLVPPRHSSPPRDVLGERGIEVCRETTDESVPTDAVGRFRYVLGREHPVVDPEVVDGVLETHTAPLMTLTSTALSKGVAPPHPAFRVLPLRVRQWLQTHFLLEALERAIETDGHVHLWTHCYNLANDAQWPPIERCLEAISEAVAAGDATVARMCDLADAGGD